MTVPAISLCLVVLAWKRLNWIAEGIRLGLAILLDTEQRFASAIAPSAYLMASYSDLESVRSIQVRTLCALAPERQAYRVLLVCLGIDPIWPVATAEIRISHETSSNFNFCVFSEAAKIRHGMQK
jgi:hypothetical protein